MKRNLSSKVLVLLGTVAMVAGASPVIAKGGRPGPPDPETVTVTMVYTDYGIATTKDCGGPLTMNLDGTSLTMDWGDAAVEMNFGPLTGCHGPLIDVVPASADVFSGNLALTQQRDGTVKLASLFDYYWEFESIGKRDVQKTLDFYSINGSLIPNGDFVWSPGGGGTLAGELLLKHFHKDYKDGAWTPMGQFPVTISVEIGSPTSAP